MEPDPKALDLSIDTRFPIRETRLEHDWKKKSESRENRKTFTPNLKFRISKSNDDFVQIQRVKRISRLLYPKRNHEATRTAYFQFSPDEIYRVVSRWFRFTWRKVLARYDSC